jgi:D-glycero-D-manno-heptose 1,7-bisphosphate phosphatase
VAARGLILDRDGVINVEVGYLHRPEQCRFVDGIFPLLGAFQARDFRLIVATNQSGIGRGYFSEAQFETLMAWMRNRMAAAGVRLDAVYHSPYHPTDGIGRYRSDSDWRKPGAGMIRQAIADFDLDPAASWAIGDHERDMLATAAAGIGHRILLDSTAAPGARPDGVIVVHDLASIFPLLPAHGSAI